MHDAVIEWFDSHCHLQEEFDEPADGGEAIEAGPHATRLAATGLHVESLALRRPTLEEAFLAYTGPPAEAARTAPDTSGAR